MNLQFAKRDQMIVSELNGHTLVVGTTRQGKSLLLSPEFLSYLSMREEVNHLLAERVLGWHVLKDEPLQYWRDAEGVKTARVLDGSIVKFCRYPGYLSMPSDVWPFDPACNGFIYEMVEPLLNARGVSVERLPNGYAAKIGLNRAVVLRDDLTPNWVDEGYLLCKALVSATF